MPAESGIGVVSGAQGVESVDKPAAEPVRCIELVVLAGEGVVMRARHQGDSLVDHAPGALDRTLPGHHVPCAARHLDDERLDQDAVAQLDGATRADVLLVEPVAGQD